MGVTVRMRGVDERKGQDLRKGREEGVRKMDRECRVK